MRTLQIVGNARYGGATYLMLEWSRYLAARGWAVDVLCTDATMIAEVRKTPELRVIDSIFIPREIAPLKDLRAFGRLCALLVHEQYDVVHTYTATPSFLGRMAAFLAGNVVSVNHQGGWTVNEFSPLHERLLYTPLEYVATLIGTRNICVCHAEAEIARRLHLAPQHKLTVICNGIRPEPFFTATGVRAGATLRRELGIGPDHLVIGNTGRLVPGKDNASLIRALPLLRNQLGDRPLTLLLAGDGDERAELEALADTLGVAEHVRFLGFWRDIPALLAALDIFVTPTLSEGMSIAVLEAMAAARPIIATDILPNAELISHEQTGLLVPVHAPEAIAQAAARFVTEPDLAQRCADAACARVLSHYTMNRMFEQTLALYHELLDQRRTVATVIARLPQREQPHAAVRRDDPT